MDAARAAGTTVAARPVNAIAEQAPATTVGRPAGTPNTMPPSSRPCEERGCRAQNHTGEQQQRRPSRDDADGGGAPCAERDPHAQLMPPPRHHVRQHTVQAGHRQQQRDSRKGAHQGSQETGRRDDRSRQLLPGSKSLHRQVLVQCPNPSRTAGTVLNGGTEVRSTMVPMRHGNCLYGK